jgi:hypothetical protein
MGSVWGIRRLPFGTSFRGAKIHRCSGEATKGEWGRGSFTGSCCSCCCSKISSISVCMCETVVGKHWTRVGYVVWRNCLPCGDSCLPLLQLLFLLLAFPGIRDCFYRSVGSFFSVSPNLFTPASNPRVTIIYAMWLSYLFHPVVVT